MALLLTLLTAWFFLRLHAPEQFERTPAPYQDYRSDAMQAALATERVSAQVDALLACGSRFLGQTGMYRAAAHMRAAFQAAGLELYEQELQTVTPRTLRRELFLVTGDQSPSGDVPIVNAEIFPFMPNHLQPMVTPADGIVGTLVRLDEATLANRERFDDCIGLLDCSTPNFDWTAYAQLGLRALIVAHPSGLEAIPWPLVAAQRNSMVAQTPVNYVRLAATPGIFNYVGRRLRVYVKTVYVEAPNTTLIGVLRAAQPARDAVVLYAPYDACSMLPDSAPGGAQALQPAILLQVLQGLLPYRATLRRDVIFITSGASVMAESGVHGLLRVLQKNAAARTRNPLLEALGLKGTGRAHDDGDELTPRMRDIRAEQAANEARRAQIVRIMKACDQPGFMIDPGTTTTVMAGLAPEDGAVFDEQSRYVLATIAFELSEPQLQAKLAYERAGRPPNEHPSFQTFLAAKRAYDEASAAIGYRLDRLLVHKAAFARERQVRRRVCERFQTLAAYHARRARELTQDAAIATLFDSYRRVAIVQPRPMPALTGSRTKEVVTVDVTDQMNAAGVPSIMAVFSTALRRLPGRDRLQFEPATDNEQMARVASYIGSAPLRRAPGMWSIFAYPVYTVINGERADAYALLAAPVTMPFMRNLDSLKQTLLLTGETVLSLAHGNGRLLPFIYKEWLDRNYGGRVVASQVGQSIVPDYPLAGAMVAARSYDRFTLPGYFEHAVVCTDPYGEYRRTRDATAFTAWVGNALYTLIGVVYDHDGVISHILDEGEAAQRLFKSANVSGHGSTKNVTLVAFRGAPVSMVDLNNPQTMRDYAGIQLLNRRGLSQFPSRCSFAAAGITTIYLEPDDVCYVTLQSGAPDNELVRITRAFMLGPVTADESIVESEISGEGYLVADTPFLRNVPFDIARSMLLVNGRRLALQERFGMVDERTEDYQREALKYLDASTQSGQPHRAAVAAARDAVTYAELNHPVLRRAVFEAVIGILWYLGLLVPFVFFFEKLVLCSTDIRRQLAMQFIVFLCVFALLRLLHPAFQMVRSSLMILLGFIVILIAGGITILFSGKFKENLEELRAKQGKVSGAEVNALGVLGSAFMLGLNNMHRRKMRTGLTCATLTLLTFAMICFTSVRNDLVDTNVALGKAMYQGLLIKRELFMPISAPETAAFTQRYGEQFDVCPRTIFIGDENWATRVRTNPQLEAVYTRGSTVRRYMLHSALLFSHAEPLQHQLTFLTRTNWFSEAQERAYESICPVMIPDVMADQLGISPERVDRGGITIAIDNRMYAVQGIFSAASLNALRDLDGRDLLPFDLEKMVTVTAPKDASLAASIAAKEDDPRIPAEQVVIAPQRPVFESAPHAHARVVSLAVSMPRAGYKEARDEITRFMQQTGQSVYYGLDGIAYKGRCTREISVAGMVDLLIPLLIAALTVLNTMRGSVYERRSEIYVYNAVGIAPRYVFAMFFAEAFVYVVVGSVLGYLLSQGTGRVLTMLDLTGGLNMTFASLTTIYASLTIALAVFVSTYFPARAAMKIAAPAEDTGWALPEPDGDALRFDLPFTFTPRERIAVLIFIERFLLEHGEGSAGRFFSSVPALRVGATMPNDPTAPLVPRIQTMVWLKPFDLAVSQQMMISLPADPETRLYKAVVTLQRLSGTREAWLRLNLGFVSELRRHFLHWRVVQPDHRDELFTEARTRLADHYAAPQPA